LPRGTDDSAQIKENGITPEQIEFPEEAVRYIVRHYTREAGVRKLSSARHGLPQAGAARGRGQKESWW